VKQASRTSLQAASIGSDGKKQTFAQSYELKDKLGKGQVSIAAYFIAFYS
jgi:hypothetical protein